MAVPKIIKLTLDLLEATVAALVERLDSQSTKQHEPVRSVSPSRPSTSPPADSAPVFMIRDAANGIGLESPVATYATPAYLTGILEHASIQMEDALSMVSMFAEHYGRWVRFDESADSRHLLDELEKSPLLLCSVLLIAVRHIPNSRTVSSASVLLEEAQRLLATSLLSVAVDMAFFRSVLILSLWSTTVGQVPLSMDGWLLTSYALQQASVCPIFAQQNHNISHSLSGSQLDAWCIWNHLCLAHLQYSIGMQRKPCVSYTQVRRHLAQLSRIEKDFLSNFEERMVAEIDLYWIIYDQCTSTGKTGTQVEKSLQSWRQEWDSLFHQPRSQFLSMGHYFALLLAAGGPKQTRTISDDSLAELIRLTTSILNLVMNTTDDRTQHLTDHIYHIITFAAITLCRLLKTHEQRLHHSHDVSSLDSLVTKLVTWLKSIGPRSHVAHMLGSVVASEQKRLRPETQPTPMGSAVSTESLQFDSALLFPDFFEAFDMDAEGLWPSWDEGPIE